MKHAQLSLPLLAACALLNANTPATAAPKKAAPATVNEQLFVVNYQHKLVTVTDGNGKTLFSHPATTPTIQAVLTPYLPTGTSPETAHSAVPLRSLTVEDSQGNRLWSTSIAVTRPIFFAFNFSTDYKGVRLKFTHNLTPPAPNSKDENGPTKPITLALKDGTGLVSYTLEGKTFPVNFSAHNFVFNTPDGTFGATQTANRLTFNGPNGQTANIGFNSDNKTGSFTLNGTKTAFTIVTRDGKEYMTFPWNGHPVFIGVGCTFNINNSGELIVDPPAKGK